MRRQEGGAGTATSVVTGTSSEDGVTVAGLVRAAARRHPDRPALVSAADGAVLTWGGLDAAVDRAAAGLSRLGLVRGDRVGLLLGNTADFPVAYFGALRAGLVAAPLNPSYTDEELLELLTDYGPRAVVTCADLARRLARLRDRLPGPIALVVGGGAAGGRGPGSTRAAGPALPPGAVTLAGATADGRADDHRADDDRAGLAVEAAPGGPLDPEALAVLLPTGGTGGRPRAAMLSHRALRANLEQCAAIPGGMRADDVVLVALPLFHVYGLNGVLGSLAWWGATGVLVERFDPVATADAVRRHGVTLLPAAPPMYVAWSMLPADGAFAGVRLAVSGAAPLDPEVAARMQETSGLRVHDGYGFTEAAPVVATTLMSPLSVPGTIGRAVPGVEIALLDADGREVEDGAEGELAVRGPSLFSGSWPDGAGRPAGDDWFRTGDVARRDAAGDLWLVGRRRDLVLVSGFNVHPPEVEQVLARHPGVAEVTVRGLPHPYTGESVQALVVRRPGALLTREELIAFAGRSLARYKCPTSVEFVDAYPAAHPAAHPDADLAADPAAHPAADSGASRVRAAASTPSPTPAPSPAPFPARSG